MYVPVAAEFGNAVEYAANVLAKRGAVGELEPFTISHVSSHFNARVHVQVLMEMSSLLALQTQWITIYWIEGVCVDALPLYEFHDGS